MKRFINRWIWVDIVFLLLFLGSTIYSFIVNDDAKFIFLIITVYVLIATTRLAVNMKHLMHQDQEIKKLNERIWEKNDFIVTLIKKYGNPKEGAEFMKDLKTKLSG